MSQAVRPTSRSTNLKFIIGFTALLIAITASVETQAITIVSSKTDVLDHNVDRSAFFTQSNDGNTYAPTDEEWFPKTSAQAGFVQSTTPTKTFHLLGTATAPTWTNGNGIPAGITLDFTAELTITALPLSGGSYLTNPGTGKSSATNDTAHGRGIGITQQFGTDGIDDIDKPDGFQVSAATISAVSFGGSLTDTNYTFTPGGVSNFGTRVFRSNNFNETVAGMLLTQGADTIGFGLANGTLASGLLANNNFGTGTGTEARSSIFQRQIGPYTLVVDGPTQTNNTAVIKGIGVIYDVTFGIAPIPPGDYNKNGVVDAADYVLWRKGDLAADSNNDTLVDQTDYDFWLARFGNGGAGAGAGLSSTSVPEPAALTLLAIGLLATCSGRRGKQLRTRTI